MYHSSKVYELLDLFLSSAAITSNAVRYLVKQTFDLQLDSLFTLILL